ncbi:MAG: hypothetical protein OHK93_002786 [Ramalina farinacea]|uniref:Uncharacterized protein n=1 Tax=Ramalina farinacea TaxID=258253 RepID=A0AA43QS91_9LECA|nr:hypothetical protein [Ramalina farinacea]
MAKPPGPPYPAKTAGLGGLPTKTVDIPICAVFLLLFLCGAVSHMFIFQTNRRRGHKFIMSGMLFGFCMARIVTQIMRITWACHPTNVSVAIASQVFVAAGVVLVFVINIIFAQRIFRARHPHLGWHRIAHYSFIGIYVLIVVTLVMLIISVVQSFYTLNAHTKHIDRAITLYGQTLYAIIAFLPIPIVLVSVFILPRAQKRPEKFGSGRWRHKIGILLVSSGLLCLGAAFRVGINYTGGTRPREDPAGYQSKACFYIFNFGVEIVVVLAYVVVRVDKRFWVPDHSHQAGDYMRTDAEKLRGIAGAGAGAVGEKSSSSEEGTGREEGRFRREESKLANIVGPEEEIFDDDHEQAEAVAHQPPVKATERGVGSAV